MALIEEGRPRYLTVVWVLFPFISSILTKQEQDKEGRVSKKTARDKAFEDGWLGGV